MSLNTDISIDERLESLQFPAPLIRQMNQIASEWAVNLGLGQLGKWFSLAPEIIQKNREVMGSLEWWNKSIFDYGPNAGMEEFRQVVAENQSKKDGRKYSKLNVLSTIGVQGAMYTALWKLSQLWARRVLIPEVNFGIYKSIPTSFGMEVVTYKLNPDYWIDLNYLESVVQSWDIMILNPVANPTGRVLSEVEMTDISNLLNKRLLQGYVISDEIYDALVYDGDVETWSFSKYFHRTIICNGVSKSGAMAGLRVGWIISENTKLIEAMTSFQTTQLSSPAPFNQALSLPIVLWQTQNTINWYNDLLRENRDRAMKILDDMWLPYIKPQWSFYIFPTIKDTIKDVKEACMKAAWDEKWVVVIPGQAFWAPKNVRISLATPNDQFSEWMERFQTLFS
jgi:aspartate aminotransferase